MKSFGATVALGSLLFAQQAAAINLEIETTIDTDQNLDYTIHRDNLSEDGPWTGHNFVDKVNKIKVVNGVIQGTNPETKRALWAYAPLTDADDVDFSNADNN